jgi:hypothetical protein
MRFLPLSLFAATLLLAGCAHSQSSLARRTAYTAELRLPGIEVGDVSKVLKLMFIAGGFRISHEQGNRIEFARRAPPELDAVIAKHYPGQELGNEILLDVRLQPTRDGIRINVGTFVRSTGADGIQRLSLIAHDKDAVEFRQFLQNVQQAIAAMQRQRHDVQRPPQ